MLGFLIINIITVFLISIFIIILILIKTFLQIFNLNILLVHLLKRASIATRSKLIILIYLHRLELKALLRPLKWLYEYFINCSSSSCSSSCCSNIGCSSSCCSNIGCSSSSCSSSCCSNIGCSSSCCCLIDFLFIYFFINILYIKILVITFFKHYFIEHSF